MKLKLIALMILGLALLPCSSKAQTTYTSTSSFTCLQGASRRPDLPWPWAEEIWNCRGINFVQNGQTVLTLSFSPYGALVETPAWTSNGPVTLTAYTQPSASGPNPTTPGTLSFNWSGTDTAGVKHSGSFSADWAKVYASLWYHPELQAGFSITVNDSAAAAVFYPCGINRHDCLHPSKGQGASRVLPSGVHLGPPHRECNENECEMVQSWYDTKDRQVLTPLGCAMKKARLLQVFWIGVKNKPVCLSEIVPQG